MSYILTGNSNPAFNLRALILAPMIQSNLLCKLDADRKVDMVLRYEGLRVDRDHYEPEANDPAKGVIATGMSNEHPGTHQQIAMFSVIDSTNTNYGPGDAFVLPLTEQTLEHALFAFIPKVITEIPQEA